MTNKSRSTEHFGDVVNVVESDSATLTAILISILAAIVQHTIYMTAHPRHHTNYGVFYFIYPHPLYPVLSQHCVDYRIVHRHPSPPPIQAKVKPRWHVHEIAVCEFKW